MPTLQDQRSLPYTPDQLYTLVLDIESYPEFLPWCLGARLLEKREGCLYASLTVGYGPLKGSFVSKVLFEPFQRIQAHYLEGPLKHLKTDWRFQETSTGSQVDFELDFEFLRGFLNKLANPLIEDVAQTMVDSFMHRAQTLYPPLSLPLAPSA